MENSSEGKQLSFNNIDPVKSEKIENSSAQKMQENQSHEKNIKKYPDIATTFYEILNMKIYEEGKGRSEEKSVILREANIQLEKIISTPEVTLQIEKIKDRLKVLEREIEKYEDELQDNHHIEGKLMMRREEEKKLKDYLEAIKSIEDSITL